MREIESAAIALHERGANVIPLAPRDKVPAQSFKRWIGRPQSEDDVARLFHRHDGNIGALGGVHSEALLDAGHLAFIDCDTAMGFDMVGALIRSGYGQTLTAKSARGGHYWIRTDDPIKTCTFAGGELRGRGAYVAAPPSLHPSGIAYRWIDVDAPIMRVNELPGFTFEVVPAERLPRLVMRILANDPAVIGRYASRSEVDRALMLSLANAGYSFARIVPLFQSSRHDSHLDRAGRDYLKRLEAEYLRATEYKHADSFIAAREFVAGVRQWALTAHDITGNSRTRETDRRVLLAHCDVAYKAGRLEWHMSRRDIEQAARVGDQTAILANRRLQAAKIIVKSREHRVSYAAKWTFGEGVRKSHHSHTLPQTVCVSGVNDDRAITFAGHATFEHSGLGRHIALTFDCIVHSPKIETEIAAATGYSLRTVNRHLQRLVHFELAAIRDGNRWQGLPKNLDDAAYALGTTGISSKRAKRIERERKDHRRRLAKPRLQSSRHEHFERETKSTSDSQRDI
jgi:hypothetical protein